MFEKGRIMIKEGGHIVQIHTTKPSQRYSGYFDLQLDQTLKETMQYNLLHTLNYVLSDKSALKDHLLLSQKLLDIKDKTPQLLTWRI